MVGFGGYVGSSQLHSSIAGSRDDAGAHYVRSLILCLTCGSLTFSCFSLFSEQRNNLNTFPLISYSWPKAMHVCTTTRSTIFFFNYLAFGLSNVSFGKLDLFVVNYELLSQFEAR